jgi:ATP-binding cassette subfamily C protein CydD
MSKQENTSEVKSYINFAGYLKVAKYAKYITKELILKVLLGLSITATYVAQAILLAMGAGSVFDGAEFSRTVIFFLLVIVCIVLRAFIVRYTEGYTKTIAGKLKTILREMIVGKLLLLGPGYQTDKRSGRFQSLVTDGVEYLEPYLVNYIPQVFIVALSLIPMVIYIFTQELTAGLIVTAAVLLAILMPHIFMPYYTKACIGYWQDYASLNSQYIDTMQGMNTLKLFNAEEEKGEVLKNSSERFRRRQLTNTRNSLFSSGTIAMMAAVAISITTGVAAYSCADGNLSTAGLLAIMFLVIECVRPIGELNNAWHSSMVGFSVASELLEILDEPIVTKDNINAKSSGIDAGLPEISFENVSFQYSSKREYALDNMSLVIKPGETAAIVGSSGSGKSTFVNLLLRFYDVGQGSIKINGTDIRDYKLDYLRSKVAVVFQSTYLFYGTVRENISMANPNASEEEIIEAAKAANAHDFIMSLPKGYGTLVGERGDTLSGGQRQRIAIARAILKKAPILVMDEATSSVDSASEKLIQQTLENLQGRFTTVLIAHRLSTIKHAEHIYVFNEGRLNESGTHEELLELDGKYRELTKAQNGGVAV